MFDILEHVVIEHVLRCGEHGRAVLIVQKKVLIPVSCHVAGGATDGVHRGWKSDNSICLFPGRRYRSGHPATLSHLPGYTISSSIVVRDGPTLLVLTFPVMADAVSNAANGSLPESVPHRTTCRGARLVQSMH